jgi:hypothetical protein
VSARLKSALLVVAALATIVAVGCGSSGAASSVAIFPMAGTPDASPKTQLSFRGQASVGGLSVKGSRTGTHQGTFKPHPDGNGTSFFPSKPFERGETVTVKSSDSLVGAKSGAVKFKIAEKPPIGVPSKVQGDPGGDPSEAHHYKSRRDLRPPTLRVTKTSSAAPGDLFLSPKAGPGQDGTLLADGSGEPIWYRPVSKGTSAYDFRTQMLEGNKPVLTWWEGEVHHGQGRGQGMIYDSTYKRIHKVPPGNGYKADFHEFQLSRDGRTAYFLIYEPVKYDLRLIGGKKDGSVLDGIVQEVDIKTGLVLFEWHTLGQVALKETYAKIPKSSPLDVSHVNSVFEEKNGNLLVSARDMHSALELDHQTGKLLWRLGGKRSKYTMGKDTQFIGQHSIARLPDERITVFDNGAPPSPGRPARAIVLKVNEGSQKVSLSKQFRRPDKPHSPSQGSNQGLPNGNFLVGWGGDSPYFNEYTPSGKVALEGKILPDKDDTYRVWKFPWTGQPSRPPDIAAENVAGKTNVYASWNGATGVASWEVLAGTTDTVIKKLKRKKFETTFHLPTLQPSVRVRALGPSDEVLGTSKAVTPTG